MRLDEYVKREVRQSIKDGACEVEIKVGVAVTEDGLEVTQDSPNRIKFRVVLSQETLDPLLHSGDSIKKGEAMTCKCYQRFKDYGFKEGEVKGKCQDCPNRYQKPEVKRVRIDTLPVCATDIDVSRKIEK